MKDGRSPNLEKGWAEAGGRAAAGKRADPRTVYVPRVNGVLPFRDDEPLAEHEQEFDDTTDDLPVRVDLKIRRNGVE